MKRGIPVRKDDNATLRNNLMVALQDIIKNANTSNLVSHSVVVNGNNEELLIDAVSLFQILKSIGFSIDLTFSCVRVCATTKGEYSSNILLKNKKNCYKKNKKVEGKGNKNATSIIPMVRKTPMKIKKSWNELIQEWLSYKKSRRESYKSPRSIKAFETRLRNLSDNNIDMAVELLEQAYACNYAGVHPLNNSKASQPKKSVNSPRFHKPSKYRDDGEL